MLTGPGGESGQGVSVRVSVVVEGVIELCLKVVVELSPGVVLVGDADEEGFHLGTQQGLERLNVDRSREAFGGPQGEAVPIVPGRLAGLRLDEEAAHADPDRELGFLLRVKFSGPVLEV